MGSFPNSNPESTTSPILVLIVLSVYMLYRVACEIKGACGTAGGHGFFEAPGGGGVDEERGRPRFGGRAAHDTGACACA